MLWTNYKDANYTLPGWIIENIEKSDWYGFIFLLRDMAALHSQMLDRQIRTDEEKKKEVIKLLILG